MELSRDIWSEITKYVDVTSFKYLSLTCVTINRLIKTQRQKYLRILWKWRNKTRNPSLNLNQYISHRRGTTVTFKSMIDGYLEYFVDHHLTKLPNFLKKTIKETNARSRIRYYRADFNLNKKFNKRRYVNIVPNPTLEIYYEKTDLKLTSLSDIYGEFNEIENGSYSQCMIELILILHALKLENTIDINAICNDRSTQYIQWNPHFKPDLTPYLEKFQQIKDRKDVKYRLSTML